LIGPKRHAASSAVTAFSPRIHSRRVKRSWATSGCGTAGSALQGFLHDRHALLEHRANRPGHLVGEQVGDPDDAAAPLTVPEDLQRGVVVREPRAADDGPAEASGGAAIEISWRMEAISMPSLALTALTRTITG
jgi:hypothetical protein